LDIIYGNRFIDKSYAFSADRSNRIISSNNLERDKKDKWPTLTLEFHTQTEDVRLKAELSRLLVDNWSLDVETNNDGEIANISETLDLRAWVWTLSKASGNPLKIALADST